MTLELTAKSGLLSPPGFHRIAANSITHEANSTLGRAIIEHLTNLDSSNRWMRKYHLVHSAHAIPQVIGLIQELCERGTLRAYYGTKLPTQSLLFLLSRDFIFSAQLRLGNGVQHAIQCVAVEQDQIRVYSSLSIPRRPDVTAEVWIDLSIFVKAWIASGGLILVMAQPREVHNMACFGLAAIDPNFNWSAFERYSSDIPVLRHLDQSVKRDEWFRRRRLRLLYQPFGKVTFPGEFSDLQTEATKQRKSVKTMKEFEDFLSVQRRKWFEDESLRVPASR